MGITARQPPSPNGEPLANGSHVKWLSLSSPFRMSKRLGGGTTRQGPCPQVMKGFLVILVGFLTICFNFHALSLRSIPWKGSAENTTSYGLFQASVFSTQNKLTVAPAPPDEHRTLVIYVFSNTDALYIHNLIRFVRVAVAADNEDGSESEAVDYLIILNGVSEEFSKILPPLPTTRARYVLHPNECFDLGTIGWALRKPDMVHLALYKWIIWVNSSVRGPFLPPSHPPNVRWHEVLTSRLNDQVKIVGPVVSCEFTPHIQSYVIATDLVGIRVLLANETVFGCHKNLWDTVIHGELGCSDAIRAAGYNMDTLVKEYSGLDWRVESPQTRQCWSGLNPVNNDFFVDLESTITELMFFKTKATFWHRVTDRALAMDKSSITETCFDWEFYFENLWNPDTPFGKAHGSERNALEGRLKNREAVWLHFTVEGYNAGQVYRTHC